MVKKTKEFYEVTPKLIKKVGKLAAAGLNIIQIGQSLGWSEDTIHKKKREHPELAESIIKGQATGIEQVTNKLHKRAVGFTVKEVHEEHTFDKSGKPIVKKKIVKKHIVPDTTAQIFYLKNRDPENWRDVQDVQHSGDIIIKTDSDDSEL